EQRVAVGRRIGNIGGSDGARCARLVLDDHVLVQPFCQLPGQHAPNHVSRTADGKGNHVGNRLCGGPVGGLRRYRDEAEHTAANQSTEHYTTLVFHGCLLNVVFIPLYTAPPACCRSRHSPVQRLFFPRHSAKDSRVPGLVGGYSPTIESPCCTRSVTKSSNAVISMASAATSSAIPAGMITTPSASPTTTSPGNTATSPQPIGTLMSSA